MKKLNTLLVLTLAIISSILGYNTGPTEARAVETPVIPRFVDVPRTNNLSGFNLNIDLNNGKVVVNDTNKNNISVNIQKKDSIIIKYKYKTRIVREPEYIRVRELPAVREKRTVVSPTFEQPTQLCVK